MISYDQFAPDLEDFWNRRRCQPRFRRDCIVYGRPVTLISNEEAPLAAVDLSLPLFSTAAPVNAPPFQVQIVVEAGNWAEPVPDDLMAYLQYAGDGDWVHLRAGQWGNAFADLGRGRATVLLTPALAARPDLFSQCLLNTILLNFFLGNGYAMLHASCLIRDGRALLLMAPHNTGKSTTALRLVLSGYQLVSDSMIHISPDHPLPTLLGFPTRRIKLRRDMVAEFPQLQPYLQAERVRDETKYTLDLERVGPQLAGPHLVVTEAVQPSSIVLCLLARGEGDETTYRPAADEDVQAAVVANSLFYDTAEVWQRNLSLIEQTLAGASCFHLSIGRDPDGILSTVNELHHSSQGLNTSF